MHTRTQYSVDGSRFPTVAGGMLPAPAAPSTVPGGTGTVWVWPLVGKPEQGPYS